MGSVALEGFGGGGGTSLNFKVICNPQPSTAKENTIWVDTDKIKNYYFSATQPENMAEYDVWFTIGAYSNVAFSATKKNPVMVYPLSAKQYIGGALVDVTTKSWQGGEWVDWWKGELFDNGNQFTHITGGWARSGLTHSNSPNTGTVSIGNEISISSGATTSAVVSTINKVNLSAYNKLFVSCNITATSFCACVTTANTGATSNSFIAGKQVDGTGKKTIEIDVSGCNESYYISLYVMGGRSGKADRVWLE